MSRMNEALLLAELGFAVVIAHAVLDDGSCSCGDNPCRTPGKHPVHSNWETANSADVDYVRAGVGKLRFKPNIGVRLGPQSDGRYLVGVDEDKPERLAFLEASLGSLPATMSGRSPSGRRLFFALPPDAPVERLRNVTALSLPGETRPEGVPTKGKDDPFAGVDVKARRGQIIVYGRNEKGEYTDFDPNAAIAELPAAWLLAILDKPKPIKDAHKYTPKTLREDAHAKRRHEKYFDRAVISECSILSRVGEGARNSLLLLSAQRLFALANGMSLPAAFGHVRAQLESAGLQTGLRQDEVRATIANAEKWIVDNGIMRMPREAPRWEPDEPRTHERERMPPSAPPSSGAAWEDSLLCKDGKVESCISNLVRILQNHPDWKGVLRLDTFRSAIVFSRLPPCPTGTTPLVRPFGDVWLEEDDLRLKAWVHETYRFDPKILDVRGAVAVVADTTHHHPVRAYFDALQWDGVARLEFMLSEYFGAADSAYTRGIGTRWMISAVARTYQPGCQADYMLILEGAQGIGKSRAVRALVPDAAWFSDTGIDISNKDSYQNLQGTLIYCFDELGSLNQRELAKTKNFLTSPVDRYRPPYGAKVRSFPRQSIFVGTTNEEHYFVDTTGNRRFWPVACAWVRPDELVSARDQLWAEAVARYRAGEPWWPDAGLNALATDEQAAREQEDPWTQAIAAWLQAPVSATLRAEGFTTGDVLTRALFVQTKDMGRGEEIRVGQVLRKLGFATRGKYRPRRYFGL